MLVLVLIVSIIIFINLLILILLRHVDVELSASSLFAILILILIIVVPRSLQRCLLDLLLLLVLAGKDVRELLFVLRIERLLSERSRRDHSDG